MSPAPASAGSPRAYWLAWLAVAAALCVPVWLPSIPPLSDYYNHLARLYILGHYGEDAAYQAQYDLMLAPTPNLALDLLGVPLLAVLPLAAVAKLFLTAAILLWHLGCTHLGRAVHGRLTWRALVCSFFVYNQQLLHGYVNFIFAMGLGLLVLAFWIQSDPRWRAWRLGLATVAATEVYFAHLAGFVTLGVAVAALILTRLVQARGPRRIDARAVAGATPLVPGAVLFAAGFLRQTGGLEGQGGGVAFAPITYNLRDAMTVLTGYAPVVDAVSMAVAAALALVALAAGRPAVRWPVLVAGLGLAALYWASPSDVATGLEVNVRFALGAYTLGILALDFGPRLRPRLRARVLAAALVLFVVRAAVTAGCWVSLDREFRAHRSAFAAIEPGASVHSIYFHPAPRVLNADRVRGLALIHSLAFAAVDRRAHVPTLYAIRGQQPLAHRRPMYDDHRFRVGERPDIPWPRVFAAYQYVWACRAPPPVLAPLDARARVVAEAGSCVLYRL